MLAGGVGSKDESVVERPHMTHKYALIGAGQMGMAVLRGAFSSGVMQPGDCAVVEPDASKHGAVAAMGCAVSSTSELAAGCDVIILAVKPQSFPEAARALGSLPAGTLVISVMAGLSSSAIRGALGGVCRVVRVMPNTPCQIGAGMSAIARGAGAQAGDDAVARSLFATIGKVIDVDESQMYAVTAVSGSGPAYVFLLAELMEQSATQLGISVEQARTLVTQTILGAARLLDESGQLPGTLREAVTSPGGTTAAALRIMYERKVPDIIVQAITAARDRGRELDRK